MVIVGCVHKVRVHSPGSASRVALSYLDVALIKRDIDSSYSYLAPESKAKQPLADYKRRIEAQHSVWPKNLQVTGFEPVDNFKFWLVYINGKTDSVELYYRVLMSGSPAIGYSVSTVQKSDTSFTHLTKDWTPFDLK